MSNTSLGMALKGSKLRMQQVANNGNLTKYFSHLLGEGDSFRFVSPLAEENFREYRLNEHELLKDIDWKSTKWPVHQPLWDGIAIGNDGKTLYLIVSVSHVDELETECDVKNKNSVRFNEIKSNLEDAFKNLKCDKKGVEFNLWLNSYYRLATHLAFFNFMKGVLKQNKKLPFKDVKLVFLNFLNDDTVTGRLIDRDIWRFTYNRTFAAMFGKAEIPNDIMLLYMDATYGVGTYEAKDKKDMQKFSHNVSKGIENLETLYKQPFVNNIGRTDSWQLCTEYIAEQLIKSGRYKDFATLKKIENSASYNNHFTHDEYEDTFVKEIFENEFLEYVGTLLDYDISLSRNSSESIDLLAYDVHRNILWILVVPDQFSDDNLLKCVLKAGKVKNCLNLEHLKRDFGIPMNAYVCVGTMIFGRKTCGAYRDYLLFVNNEQPKLKELMEKLQQSIIVIDRGTYKKEIIKDMWVREICEYSESDEGKGIFRLYYAPFH